jgi:YT521-B-like domain
MLKFSVKLTEFRPSFIHINFQNGSVYLVFSLDESGRFLGYATMESEIGAVQPMAWMKEHCDPVGAAFKVEHHTTYPACFPHINDSDEVRTNSTTKCRNFYMDQKPIRFGLDGQEISPREGNTLVEELERMSGPENAHRRANAVVTRGSGRRGRVILRRPRRRGHWQH